MMLMLWEHVFLLWNGQHITFIKLVPNSEKFLLWNKSRLIWHPDCATQRNPSSLEERLNPSLRQDRSKMSLQCLTMRDSKEATPGSCPKPKSPLDYAPPAKDEQFCHPVILVLDLANPHQYYFSKKSQPSTGPSMLEVHLRFALPNTYLPELWSLCMTFLSTMKHNCSRVGVVIHSPVHPIECFLHDMLEEYLRINLLFECESPQLGWRTSMGSSLQHRCGTNSSLLLRNFFMHSMIILACLTVTSCNKTVNFYESLIAKYNNNTKMS